MKTCQWSSSKQLNGTNSAKRKPPFCLSGRLAGSHSVSLMTGSIMGKLGLSRELQAGPCVRIWLTSITNRKSINILYQQVNSLAEKGCYRMLVKTHCGLKMDLEVERGLVTGLISSENITILDIQSSFYIRLSKVIFSFIFGC